MQAHLHMQALTVHAAEGAEEFLVVRVNVTCDVCGDHDLVIAGHHIKPLLKMLHSVLDEVDPALVDAGEEVTVHRSAHHVTDPRNN